MTQADWTLLALHIAAMLACAIVMGNLFRRFGMPNVVGEIFGGILLGPTLLGRYAPDLFNWLFPTSGPINQTRTGMMRTGMLFFIVTIGLDISLREFHRLRKKALWVGIVGTFVPLFLGILMVYVFPNVIGVTGKDQFQTALFMGAIISLSANPIIARILMDLNLFKTDIGKTIMSATLVDDLVGWSLFAVVLAEFAPGSTRQGQGLSILGIVALFVVAVLLLGRYVVPRLLDFAKAKLPMPMSYIGILSVFTLLGAAGSESLGLHSFLGAFLVGIALAEMYGRDPQPFETMRAFTLAVITPVFFVSMGIGADFIKGFDLATVLLITAVAFFGKILGVFVGGKFAGMDNTEALAVGAGMNARGIIGIVMAAVAYESKLIDLRLYVACILMCLFTTMAAGPALRIILGKRYDMATEEPAPKPA